MRNLTYVGMLLLVLGVLAFVVPIPHSGDHGVRIGDTKIGIQTESSEKLPSAVGVVLLVAGAIIVFAWRFRVAQLERANAVQLAFSQQLIASQENERKRIAGELHDSLGHRLLVIKNLTHFLHNADNGNDDNGKQTLDEISEEASLAIEETRQISYDLRPFQLDRLGLKKAIEALIRTVSNASGIRFSSDIDKIDDLFAEDLRINFYRVVQESLGNIMKHAQAKEVTVRIKKNEESVTLTIVDNGRGFVPASPVPQNPKGGFGLIGMAERARLLGGQFKIQSAPGRGTIMTVEIALGKAARG